MYMKELSTNKLFDIFSITDEEVYEEHHQGDVMRNPFVLMGMVLRGLENWVMLDMMYTKKYPKQYSSVRNKIRNKYNDRLMGYLDRIDWKKYETIHSIGESYDRREIENGMNHLIKYYEKLEDYEKCAILVEYLNLLYIESVDIVGQVNDILKGV